MVECCLVARVEPLHGSGELAVHVSDGLRRRPCRPTRTPPSRSSTASCTPVDAPDGTIARPNAPDSSRTSTSTVGLPRESSTWRPCTAAILAVTSSSPLPRRSRRPARRAEASSNPCRAARRAPPQFRRASRKRFAAARSSSSGIDVQPARDVDGGEQHVAQLGGRPRRPASRLRGRIRGRQLGAELAQLVVEVGERACEIRVLEADRLRAELHLARVEQRGQALGHVVEDPLAALVLALDLLPALAHTRRRSAPRRRRRRADGADELRVTMPRSPARGLQRPFSWSSSARKTHWNSRSPISSRSFASSPASAASATSYASSTVCGTIVRVVCSRSQGHSRRSRSVSSWSSTSASASRHQSGSLGRRRVGGRRRAGIGARHEADLVLDLRRPSRSSS